MNAVISMVGRIGQDPKNQIVGDQEKVYASLGVSRDYKKPGEKYPVTDWFQFEVWGKKGAALMQYGKKGKAIKVVGRPEFYTDKEGKERLTIRNATWSFLPQDSKGAGSSQSQGDDWGDAPYDADELPF